MKYAPGVQEEHEFNDHVHFEYKTESMFINKNPKYCPIRECFLREDDCKTHLPPKTAEMMDWNPWEISANNDVVAGWKRNVCAICNN